MSCCSTKPSPPVTWSSASARWTAWNQLRADGMTYVFVSHWLSALEQVSDEVICLDQGRIVDRGSPPDVISRYNGGDGFADHPGTGPVQVRSAHAIPESIDPLEALTVAATLRVVEPAQRVDVRLRLVTPAGRILAENQIEEASRVAAQSPGEYRLEGHVGSFPMAAGTYHLVVAVIDRLDGTIVSRAATEVTVRGLPRLDPRLGLQPRWKVEEAPNPVAAGPELR